MTSANNKSDISEIVRAAAIDGHITCARGLELSGETGYTPAEIGDAMDDNKIRITLCQLGLFGYDGGKKIKPSDVANKNVEDAINAGLVDGKISCDAIWRIAEELRIKKFDVACACEKIKIRINKCQLGAF